MVITVASILLCFQYQWQC